ncbi:MAG: succinylglutamate desuccinylase/aspartoacylase family protein [Phycisphaerales bacterium]
MSADTFHIARARVGPGETRDLSLKVSESYSGAPIRLPVRVIRGTAPGPALFVCGAVHGDELNGAGIVRELILGEPPAVVAGTLVLVPVVNMFGFEHHSRYLPDRRDLNRSFPGSRAGSLTARLASTFFREVVLRCQYGIDLHSAASHRTNLPHIRADLTEPRTARLARAFGCELIVNTPGPEQSLRRAACQAGCATVVLEAGEVWKVERDVLRTGVRGVQNVLAELGMIEGTPREAPYQIEVARTVWVRSPTGGMLQFHVALGELVERGQPVAVCSDLLGHGRTPVRSHVEGVVMSVSTLPVVKPGDPVCHIAVPTGGLPGLRASLEGTQPAPADPAPGPVG